ncbi:NAD-dependent epimerase/dehydratase family protein [Pseudomonas sp. P3C3]
MDLRCRYSESAKIAVTGSTGYIGSCLIDAWGEGCFAETPFSNVPAGALVLHFAANISQSSVSVAENVMIDMHVLDVANAKHRGVIYLSGNNVYPYMRDCRVTDFVRVMDNYSASKVFGERIFCDLAKVPVVILRVADVFGAGQRHGNFFKAVEAAVLQGSSLRLYGQGLKRRTYIHARELVHFIRWIAQDSFAEMAQRKILNVGYPDALSVKDILDRVSVRASLPVEVKVLEQDNSALDIRTMEVAFPSGYRPLWPTFAEALDAYVDELIEQKAGVAT